MPDKIKTIFFIIARLNFAALTTQSPLLKMKKYF